MSNTKVKANGVSTLAQDYNTLFYNPLIGIVRVDSVTFEVLEANAKAFDILALDIHTSRSLHSFFSHDLAERIQRVSATRDGIDTEILVERCKGVQRWVRLNCTFVPQCGHLHILLMDVTAEKKRLFDRNGLHDNLDQFVYRASHNLRSPITTLLGLLELAKLNNRSFESLANYLQLMTDRVKYLDQLLLDLICIANNEKAPVDLVNVLLEQEVQSVVNEYARENKNFTYTISGNQSNGFVTDQGRLKIILRNIISNAIKFSHPLTDPPHVELFFRTEAETAHIAVTDHGIGIDPVSLKKIFNIFYKATNDHPGAGLGLYIVRRVIDKLGGDISVVSTLHKGTTFTISLPNNCSRQGTGMGTIL